MKQHLFKILAAGTILLLCVAGLVSYWYIGFTPIGDERASSYSENLVAVLAPFHRSERACLNISPNALNLFPGNPAGAQKEYERSYCLQRLAVTLRDASLCDQIITPPLNSEGKVSKEKCLAELKSADAPLDGVREIPDGEIAIDEEQLYLMLGYDLDDLYTKSGFGRKHYWSHVPQSIPDVEMLKKLESYQLFPGMSETDLIRKQFELAQKWKHELVSETK